MNRLKLNILDAKLYVFTLFLNICSSCFTFLGEMEFNIIGLLIVISLSSLFSFFICTISTIFRRNKVLHNTYYFICVGIILLFILVESFLWYNFRMIFNENIFSIIEGTNINESIDFITTYFDISILIIGCMGTLIILVNYISVFLSKYTKIVNVFIIISLIFAAVKITTSVYSSVVYKFGGHLAAYSTYTRVGRSVFLHYKFMKETNCLIDNLKKITPFPINAKCDKVVVVIGESYSKYHSQLYGYGNNTNPLLSKRVDNGEIYIFTDVITPINDTERVFRSIYSLGGINEGVYSDFILFPYAFRLAGFYTANIDNMDLARKTSRIKDSKELSNLMFDFRNDVTYQYDESIIKVLDLINKKSTHQLYVIKLRGQHYTYADTFPEEYKYFMAERDYENINLPIKTKQVIADYDNSTMYNDYVVNRIIEYFEAENAVVIYFSDHGEEVYDARNYMGHGGTSPYLNYQVEIPFMMWMSDSYKLANPNIVKNIIQNVDKPYTTDYVAHAILDLAGVECPQYIPERSIVNDSFKSVVRRVVNNSLIYEENVLKK